MAGVLNGLSLMWIIIGVGYFLGRFRVLGSSSQSELARFVYYVASPALLFATMVATDIRAVIGIPLVVAAVCGMAASATYTVVGLVAFRDTPPQRVIGAMSSGLANAGYLGIPLATYILGSASYVTPVLLFQLGFFTPSFFVLADLSSGRHKPSVRSVVEVIVSNPLLVASAVGILLSLFRVRLPAIVFDPVKVLGAAAVPCILVSFGLSLCERDEDSPLRSLPQVTLATVCKLVVQPLVAWAVAHYVFGWSGFNLFAVVAMAALPTAQNAYVAAFRAGSGNGIARGTVLATTIFVTPVLMVVAALLSHAP